MEDLVVGWLSKADVEMIASVLFLQNCAERPSIATHDSITDTTGACLAIVFRKRGLSSNTLSDMLFGLLAGTPISKKTLKNGAAFGA